MFITLQTYAEIFGGQFSCAEGDYREAQGSVLSIL